MQNGTRMGRKGVDPITGIIVVIIIAMLVFTIFATANIVISTNAVRQDARETSAISVINGMDFLKRAMQEGVVYATERATYDVLAKGGYDTVPADLTSKDGTAYWRKYGQTSVPDFKAELEAATAKHFESYGTAYGTAYPSLGLGVSLSVPQYSSCGRASIIDNDDSVGVSIASRCADGLKASNEFMTVTESNADFQADVPVNVFALVSAAKATFVDSDPVYGAVVAGTSSTACRSISVSEASCRPEYSGDATSVGSALLQSQCSDWQSKLSDAIESQLSGIAVSGATAAYSIVSMSAEYRVDGCGDVCTPVTSSTYTCTIDQCLQSCTSCTEGEPNCKCVTTFDPITGRETVVCTLCTPSDPNCPPPTTSDGACPSPCPGSSCTTNMITTTSYMTSCDYSYSADVDVGVALTQQGGYYPIYDAASEPSTQWKHMTLRFRVLDGASQPAPTPTTSSTTTTVPRPACSSTSCGAQVSDCLCGVNVCDSGRYCCASSSGCYTSQDSCLESC